MDNIKIATAQFEHRNGDKSYNLSMIRQLSAAAKDRGAQVIAYRKIQRDRECQGDGVVGG